MSEVQPLLQARRQRASLMRGIVSLYALLFAANAAAWIWALVVVHGDSVLLGLASLAYLFGLRHAVDADHIAAIDNVTRKLMQRGDRPVSVGLYFAIGHSTVVVGACAGIAAMAGAMRGRLEALSGIGELIGASVSAGFLFLIALANVGVLGSVLRSFRAPAGGEVAASPPPGGLASRLLAPLTAMISQPWHMLPLGFLFGLGFDTATEVGLLALSAGQAAHLASPWTIMVLPALFAAGMSLVDATDGVLMVGAYGWAFIKPRRKLIYNLVVTLLSILVSVVVGALEVLKLVGDRLSFTGPFWRWVGLANAHFTAIGVMIVLLMAACWGGSVLISRGRTGEAAANR